MPKNLFRVFAAAVLSFMLLITAALVVPTRSVSASLLPASLTILFVGDSTSVGGPDEGYREELGRLLDEAGVSHTFFVEAHGGWACASWINWMQYLTNSYKPDVTVINCGTNDAANGWSSATYDANYNSLINLAKAGHPSTKVLPVWIQYSANRQPWSGMNLLAGEKMVNDAIYRQTINRAGVIFPPADFQGIPEIYLLGPIDSSDPGGLHKTPAGQKIEGRQLYKALINTFGLPVNPTADTCGLMGGYGYIPSYTPCNVLATV